MMEDHKTKPELIQLTDQVIDWRLDPSASRRSGGSIPPPKNLVRSVIRRFFPKKSRK